MTSTQSFPVYFPINVSPFGRFFYAGVWDSLYGCVCFKVHGISEAGTSDG